MTRRRKGKRHYVKGKRRRSIVVARDRDGVYIATRGDDLGTAERSQHQGGLVLTDGTVTTSGLAKGTVARARGEHWIDLWERRGLLGAEEELKRRMSAVAWLLGRWEESGLSPKMTGGYNGITSKGISELTPTQSEARQKLASMFGAIGRWRAELLIDAVCLRRITEACIPATLAMSLDRLAAWQRL